MAVPQKISARERVFYLALLPGIRTTYRFTIIGGLPPLLRHLLSAFELSVCYPMSRTCLSELSQSAQCYLNNGIMPVPYPGVKLLRKS